MTQRYEEQMARILAHEHVGSVNTESYLEKNWKGELEMRVEVTVWCKHHHAPFSQRASTLETCLGRVETWLETRESESWRGVACGRIGFAERRKDFRVAGEWYST